MQLRELKEKILSTNRQIIISTHLNPDGDAIGSEVALAHSLKKIGKDVLILNQDRTPIPFKFLETHFEFTNMEKFTDPGSSLILLIDVNEIDKLGDKTKGLLKTLKDAEILFIDHHNPEYFDDNFKYFTFESISSTGEVIYKLIRNELKVPLDKVIAESIYTAIISDTKSFRYSKTTAYSHRIASELIEFGIKPEKVQLEVFGKNSLNQIHLLGFILSNAKLSSCNKIAYVFLPFEIMTEHNISASETKGFINYLLTIKGVEVAVLFRQDTKHSTKVSIRSKGNYPIYDFAERYGGGGHRFAATFTSTSSKKILVEKTISELEKLTMENSTNAL